MSEADKLAIAAHLHVLLRRKTGRVTDTEWMAVNAEYALAGKAHDIQRIFGVYRHPFGFCHAPRTAAQQNKQMGSNGELVGFKHGKTIHPPRRLR